MCRDLWVTLLLSALGIPELSPPDPYIISSVEPQVSKHLLDNARVKNALVQSPQVSQCLFTKSCFPGARTFFFFFETIIIVSSA